MPPTAAVLGFLHLARVVVRSDEVVTVIASVRQRADCGGAQIELSFVVYQISAQVGRGFPGERTVEIVP